MSDPGVTSIRIRRGDKVFHVHGDNAGKEGVYLAMGQVEGIYDAPVKTTWKTGAFQVGSQQKARKFLHRDLSLGFHIIDTTNLYELNESEFRQIFDYQEDFWDTDYTPATIEVETILSGVRKLDVLMYDTPDFKAAVDPLQDQYGNLILRLRAGQPFWYEDDVISTFTSTESSATGTVTVENPTDNVMYQKFILTRGTWALPDFQWVGAKGLREPGGPNSDRTITNIVVSDVNGGAVVDLDRQELMFRDANDTNILAQLSGKFFNYAIPPYTPETDLPVSYSGAPLGGAMVQLVQPRRWSRPWGLEYVAADQLKSTTFRLTTAGAYSVPIPEWCNTIDVVLLGDGGGGDGGDLEFGTDTVGGGDHGEWVTATWTRGVEIPWDATEITGTIGAGGPGGGVTLLSPDPGQNGTGTTAICEGPQSLEAAGGTGGGNGANNTGLGAGVTEYNGKWYRAGADTTSAGHDGSTPGGGGAAGQFLQAGGKGARGAVWIRCYQVAT